MSLVLSNCSKCPIKLGGFQLLSLASLPVLHWRFEMKVCLKSKAFEIENIF